MNQLPTMASITDLKHRHLEVFAQLKKGPVVIANRNQPAGVLVSPEQWDCIAEEMENLNDVIAALRAELAIATGEEIPIQVDPDELVAWATGDVNPA